MIDSTRSLKWAPAAGGATLVAEDRSRWIGKIRERERETAERRVAARTDEPYLTKSKLHGCETFVGSECSAFSSRGASPSRRVSCSSLAPARHDNPARGRRTSKRWRPRRAACVTARAIEPTGRSWTAAEAACASTTSARERFTPAATRLKFPFFSTSLPPAHQCRSGVDRTHRLEGAPAPKCARTREFEGRSPSKPESEPRVGLEPTTCALRKHCSTAELSRR